MVFALPVAPPVTASRIRVAVPADRGRRTVKSFSSRKNKPREDELEEEILLMKIRFAEMRLHK